MEKSLNQNFEILEHLKNIAIILDISFDQLLAMLYYKACFIK